MKFNFLFLALMLTLTTVSCKKDSDNSKSSGSAPTANAPATTSGSSSDDTPPPEEWDPNGEGGWFPDWGDEDTTTAGTSSGSTSGASTAGTSATSGSADGTSSGSTDGSVDAGATAGSTDSGSVGTSSGTVEPDPGTTTTGGTSGTTSSGSSDGSVAAGSTSGSDGSSTLGVTAGDSSGTSGTSSGATVGTESGATDGSASAGSSSGTTGGDSGATTLGASSGNSSGEDVTPGYGNLNVKLTASAFAGDIIQSAKVTIVKMEAQKVGIGFVKIFEGSSEFDLINLQNGLTTTMANSKIAIGTYDQLKVYITKASITLKDGRESSVNISGGATTGIKVLITPVVKVYTGQVSEVVFSIDSLKSFVLKGSTNVVSKVSGFSFKLISRAANTSQSGTVYGKLMNDSGTPDNLKDDKPVVGALIRFSKNGQTIVSTVSSTRGEYRIIGVPANTGYSVLYAAQGYDSREFNNVDVLAGDNKQMNLFLNPNPQSILPLLPEVIKPELVKGTTDIVAEVVSYNTSVTVEATNGLQAKVLIIDSRLFVVVKANSIGLGVVTITDKKGQTSSFEIRQVTP